MRKLRARRVKVDPTRSYYGSVEDRTEERGVLSEVELRRLAYRDHLTGLANRIAMADRIDAALSRCGREGSSAALLFLDVDSFKRVNDTLGHAAGDELLRRIADRLERVGDRRVTAGRHAGDEFLLLIDDLPYDRRDAAAAVSEIAARISASLAEPFTVLRATFEISTSLGASMFPHDARDQSDLLQHADQAMYMAKRRGRARTVLFEVAETHSVLELETTLRVRRGLSAGEFHLAYQPVIEIADGHTLAGLEALLRWQDPDRGLLAPTAFLPFIEDSPLIEEIGEWVFAQVASQAAEWSARGFSPQISFNIPAQQLRRTRFADFMRDTAARAGADPRRLVLEVTESTYVELEEVLPTLEKLCDSGFLLSLDDFGIGYSSLARLRTMPFTLLKTDRSFMNGVPGLHVAEELLEGIIALGKSLGMHVIVEGVEEAEQEQTLLRLGCRRAQGFHLGAPTAPEEIEARWSSLLSSSP
ncbi:MAG: EAL domain-containing protein [Solirubrobacterales bacterium]|nr:EAL domain-containing protein [Solirubrobacterales bacterium]